MPDDLDLVLAAVGEGSPLDLDRKNATAVYGWHKEILELQISDCRLQIDCAIESAISNLQSTMVRAAPG
jgi:hypothetical protein